MKLIKILIAFPLAASLILAFSNHAEANKRSCRSARTSRTVLNSSDSKTSTKKEVALKVVTPSQADGLVNEHGYVDLGLSVKWATCNVGAVSPEEYGDYFAWGEVVTKRKYADETSLSYRADWADVTADRMYDAAMYNWSKPWRLPTREEFQELIANTTPSWATFNGVKGCLFTSKINGKSIFIPASGSKYDVADFYLGEYGNVWSGSASVDDLKRACSFYFDGKTLDPGWYRRYLGLPVRPVTQ